MAPAVMGAAGSGAVASLAAPGSGAAAATDGGEAGGVIGAGPHAATKRAPHSGRAGEQFHRIRPRYRNGGASGKAPGHAASPRLDVPVVVAVPLVRVVQVAADQVVDVIAVRDPGVTAGRAVDVTLLVPPARVGRGAGGGVFARHRDHVLVHVRRVDVVQVAVVEVVDVPLVLNGRVPTTRAVDVRMGFVRLVLIHRAPLVVVPPGAYRRGRVRQGDERPRRHADGQPEPPGGAG